MIDVRWMWLFLDTPRADAGRSWAFWSEVTGWPLSATRGDHDEFATLLPPRGDAWLKVQAVADGPGGIHLDLDVADVQAAAREAERRALAEVLERVRWNRTAAARILKVSYKTLLSKLAECGLVPPKGSR